MAAAEGQLSRPASFGAGVAETFFGAEQSFFSLRFFAAGVCFFKLGLIPLSLAAFGLSLAPVRAVAREVSSAWSHFKQSFSSRRAAGHH